jgi:hypothetical protein
MEILRTIIYVAIIIDIIFILVKIVPSAVIGVCVNIWFKKAGDQFIKDFSITINNEEERTKYREEVANLYRDMLTKLIETEGVKSIRQLFKQYDRALWLAIAEFKRRNPQLYNSENNILIEQNQ